MKYVIIYWVVVNIVTFGLFAYDKRQAKNGGWRIKEATLLFFCAAGGAVGGLCAMNFCRHKTKKPAFYIGLPVILALHALIIAYFYHRGVLVF